MEDGSELVEQCGGGGGVGGEKCRGGRVHAGRVQWRRQLNRRVSHDGGRGRYGNLNSLRMGYAWEDVLRADHARVRASLLRLDDGGVCLFIVEHARVEERVSGLMPLRAEEGQTREEEECA
jgi:hypothetical protein